MEQLPVEILLRCFQRLELWDLLSASAVCSEWCAIADSPELWLHQFEVYAPGSSGIAPEKRSEFMESLRRSDRRIDVEIDHVSRTTLTVRTRSPRSSQRYHLSRMMGCKQIPLSELYRPLLLERVDVEGKALEVVNGDPPHNHRRPAPRHVASIFNATTTALVPIACDPSERVPVERVAQLSDKITFHGLKPGTMYRIRGGQWPVLVKTAGERLEGKAIAFWPGKVNVFFDTDAQKWRSMAHDRGIARNASGRQMLEFAREAYGCEEVDRLHSPAGEAGVATLPFMEARGRGPHFAVKRVFYVQ